MDKYTKTVLLLTVIIILSVSARYVYRGVELYDCESYDGQNCNRIYSDERFASIQLGTKVVSKDLFTDKKEARLVVATPGEIEEVLPGCFAGLNYLKVIYLGGQRLKNIPYGVFNDLPITLLYLGGNALHNIDYGALDMKNLEILNMRNNKLTVFDPSWFTDGYLRSLVFIRLHNNRIRALNCKAFYKFPRLKEIDFSFNEIEYICNDIFNHEANIELLSLRHNRIKRLSANTFNSVNYIDRLLLSYNHLKSMDLQLMEKTLINRIEMNPNLWKCSCLLELEQKLYEKEIEEIEVKDEKNGLICNDAGQVCGESDSSNSLEFERTMNVTYEKYKKHCRVNRDCPDEFWCRADYCWPLILKVMLQKDDRDFFWLLHAEL